MLHEWDADNPPNPLPFVMLSARQAMKLADFIGDHCQHVNQLVVQSEFASSQRSAIAEAIGDWTGAFLERGDVWPTEHKSTTEILQMAFDAFEITDQVLPHSSDVRSSEDYHVQQLIGLICSQTNVALIASSRIQECYTATADRRCDIDASLGICLEQGERSYTRPSSLGTSCGGPMDIDLQNILTSYPRRVCCNGGCPTCLPALHRWEMPFCLAVILDERHLPPTFEHVLEAGGNWAIIANEKTIDRIEQIVAPFGEFKATKRGKGRFGLVTIGDAPACAVIHEIYRCR